VDWRAKLTCIFEFRFLFTPCMNFHISVDFGVACSHNFRGTSIVVEFGDIAVLEECGEVEVQTEDGAPDVGRI
jgi:hypothetical protein